MKIYSHTYTNFEYMTTTIDTLLHKLNKKKEQQQFIGGHLHSSFPDVIASNIGFVMDTPG